MVFLLVPSTSVWQHTLGTHCARAAKTTARRAHTFNQNVSTFLPVFVHNGGWALRIVHPHISTHNMAQTIRTPYACGRALPAQRFSTEAVFGGALSRPFAVRCTHTHTHTQIFVQGCDAGNVPLLAELPRVYLHTHWSPCVYKCVLLNQRKRMGWGF